MKQPSKVCSVHEWLIFTYNFPIAPVGDKSHRPLNDASAFAGDEDMTALSPEFESSADVGTDDAECRFTETSEGKRNLTNTQYLHSN
jgi:hypothetical protein